MSAGRSISRVGVGTLIVVTLLCSFALPAYAIITTEFRTNDGGPQKITAGPDGALWFVERDGNKIERITTASVVTAYSIPTAKIFSAPSRSGRTA